MKGKSKAMTRVREAIEKMALADYPVLITGESGVGKELVARAIHASSLRRAEPYVAVNCGCIPDLLAESELFGAARGAYTGADADRPGLFEAAHRGTLFLDEIETLSMSVQERLLRVIDTGTFRRLGELAARSCNVRIIAAGNRPLPDLIQASTFRSDLYYRLNVLAIHVPPLRERIDDVPELAQEFLRKAGEETGLGTKRLSEEAVEALQSYSWPGNVRELENAVRRAVVSSIHGTLGEADFEFLRAEPPPADSIKGFARAAVERRRGSLADVARRLGISRKTLWAWRKQWEAGGDLLIHPRLTG
jgi:DNA-binding NtrC family response regulator